MRDEQVLFRHLDTVSLAEPNPVGKTNPTFTRECAQCLRYARESEEPEPIGWFSPCMVMSRLRGRELPSELLEDLEMEERPADERVALWYDKGGECSATFHTVMDLMQKNLSLKTQLQMAIRSDKEAAEKKEPETPVQDGTEQEGDHVEEPEKKGGASNEPARVRSATPPIDAASSPATPPSDTATSLPTTPSCRRRRESSGGQHPPLLPEAMTAAVTPAAAVQPMTTSTPEKAACPTATFNQTTDERDVVTSRICAWTELQQLYKESEMESDEAIISWLDLMAMEFKRD
ncbi:uncharacterized protein LOC109283160 [Alligator mississippiensis]|uniref:uncharacterized protein LOC109283160 n=1 Tax=Alligator mississippiensis TaxID=8496 RepID=UPI002877A94B|nr:uncharacterized protein LOC109283160 [Alligator mississippiensis]